jgi:hypothetical protein
MYLVVTIGKTTLMDNVRLDGFFPTPVLTVIRPEPYTNEEYNFVKNIPLVSGPNNDVSVASNVLDFPGNEKIKKFYYRICKYFYGTNLFGI